jgi:predicted cupin superfamily sugar epimerase
MSTAEELIQRLGLVPHPKEGGYFRETYRSGDAHTTLAQRYQGSRCAGTAIYYLLTPSTYSALHRLQTDEIFHFYLGDPIRMLQLDPDGQGRTIVLGPDVLHGQQLQVVVPRGIWQGSFLEPGGAFALLGCTVAPGFEYADYEAGDRQTLLKQYPAFTELIQKLIV